MGYEVGDLILGTVNQIRPYALFLTFDDGSKGLLHISEISDDYVRDIELFGSMPPFAKNYTKNWIEPFALKVKNTEHLKEAINKTNNPTPRLIKTINLFWVKVSFFFVSLIWDYVNIINTLKIRKIKQK